MWQLSHVDYSHKWFNYGLSSRLKTDWSDLDPHLIRGSLDPKVSPQMASWSVLFCTAHTGRCSVYASWLWHRHIHKQQFTMSNKPHFQQSIISTSHHSYLFLLSSDFQASLDPSHEILYLRKLSQESTSTKQASYSYLPNNINIRWTK